MSLVFLMSIGTAMAQDKKPVDSDYVVLLNEKVYHSDANGVNLIKGTLKLNNGTVVKEDGTYMLDGKTMKLKDGECLGMSGKKYKSQLDLAKKLKKKMKKK